MLTIVQRTAGRNQRSCERWKGYSPILMTSQSLKPGAFRPYVFRAESLRSEGLLPLESGRTVLSAWRSVNPNITLSRGFTDYHDRQGVRGVESDLREVFHGRLSVIPVYSRTPLARL